MVCMCSIQYLQAQKKSNTKVPFEFSLQEETTLRLKKMTLVLDLTLSQQKEMQPIISEMITHTRENRKENAKKTQNKAQAFARINKKLDFKIAMKKKIKEVLNNKQYEQFSEIKTRESTKKRKQHHNQRSSKMS